jgi:apolipoprotein N-acyltransferase
MSWIRFLIVILVAALTVPLIEDVLQFGAIAARNGHWFAWLPAIAQSVRLLPLAFMTAPLYIPAVLLVAAFSLGLEHLIARRSLLIWVCHGLAMGGLFLLWLFPFSRPGLVAFGSLGSWLLVSVAMWYTLSRGRSSETSSGA